MKIKSLSLTQNLETHTSVYMFKKQSIF